MKSKIGILIISVIISIFLLSGSYGKWKKELRIVGNIKVVPNPEILESMESELSYLEQELSETLLAQNIIKEEQLLTGEGITVEPEYPVESDVLTDDTTEVITVTDEESKEADKTSNESRERVESKYDKKEDRTTGNEDSTTPEEITEAQEDTNNQEILDDDIREETGSQNENREEIIEDNTEQDESEGEVEENADNQDEKEEETEEESDNPDTGGRRN